MNDYNEANEKCWITGMWDDMCICELCEHNYDCSGSNVDWDDDD